MKNGFSQICQENKSRKIVSAVAQMRQFTHANAEILYHGIPEKYNILREGPGRKEFSNFDHRQGVDQNEGFKGSRGQGFE